jgi:hypothetical protein
MAAIVVAVFNRSDRIIVAVVDVLAGGRLVIDIVSVSGARDGRASGSPKPTLGSASWSAAAS